LDLAPSVDVPVSVSTSFGLSARANASVIVASPFNWLLHESGSTVILESGPTSPLDLEQGPVVPITSVGRFRLGDVVPIAFVPAAAPLSAPVFIISHAEGDKVLETPGWTWDGETFRIDVLLDNRFRTGTFVVRGEFVEQFELSFDVVPGGDPGSSVIATYCHEGNSRRVVLAQLKSGQLVSGVDPYLEG
jgi:hypothetical protein